jgi:hypothetical protein
MSSREQKDYKLGMQKKGISLTNQPAMSVPQKANKVSNKEPGLGARTISHPYKASKKSI